MNLDERLFPQRLSLYQVIQLADNREIDLVGTGFGMTLIKKYGYVSAFYKLVVDDDIYFERYLALDSHGGVRYGEKR